VGATVPAPSSSDATIQAADNHHRRQRPPIADIQQPGTNPSKLLESARLLLGVGTSQ